MAQRRMISKSVSNSHKLAKISTKAALLWTWMIPHVDDYGCFFADKHTLKRFIVPLRDDFSVKTITNCVRELEEVGLIRTYKVDGYEYLEMLNFDKHQTLKTGRKLRKEVPEPPDGYTNWVSKRNPIEIQVESKRKSQVEVEEEEEVEGEGDIHDTCIDKTLRNAMPESCVISPPPLQEEKPSYPAGWQPTDETQDQVTELLRRLEGVFGVWPFTQAQRGNGEEAAVKEELAAILRLLTVEEVVEIVRREMEAKAAATKGVDRPRNIKWYLKPIKDAFYAKDRAMEEAERKRDEAKRSRARASPEEPASMSGLLEEVVEETEMTEEERQRVIARIRQVREQIAKAGKA